MVQSNIESAARWPLAVPSVDPTPAAESWWSPEHLVDLGHLWPWLVVPAGVGLAIYVVAKRLNNYDAAPVVSSIAKVIDAFAGLLSMITKTLGIPAKGFDSWITSRRKRSEKRSDRKEKRDTMNDVIEGAGKIRKFLGEKANPEECLGKAENLYFRDGGSTPEVDPEQPPNLRQVK